ncbi:LUD domain-containing protein [Salinimicrobium tongyeongense]|uniref:LUD domain-containing protein n=1 Tax=Salinimicrobium tongyeongense TaxID=2809707 RepID=A0ABY6NUT6_9FLAO|nr:LUD domain-containing protein [Salinimicrobium tongyeongense]UZH56684.1 LUD domain-containing protein [Salinimicrobium tongyeongense]
MKSRERILNSLKSANSIDIDLPQILFSSGEDNILQTFVEMATLAGMEVFDATKIDLMELLTSCAESKKVQSSIESHAIRFPILLDEEKPFETENVPDIFVCQAHFGVAENAALWLDDEVLPSRLLAFLPEELVILLSKEQLVSNMHQAYDKVEQIDYTYGLFLAGPSKTADIEQTLVTGAQGAKRVKLFLQE